MKSQLEKDITTKVPLDSHSQLESALEKTTTIPDISDLLASADAALAAAQKAAPTITSWYCTNCSATGLQLYDAQARKHGKDHFNVWLEDGIPTTDYGPLKGDELRSFNAAKSRGKL